ncbi:MAG: hypothetical protein K0R84_615 [Clostridia bacterium]|jgi:general stress protein CsbA|nr:hypothetical protein [Clostridia bacterium]
MIYLYTLIAVNIYFLYKALYKKEDKILLLFLIPTLFIILFNHTTYFDYLSSKLTSALIWGSLIVTSLAIIFHLILTVRNSLKELKEKQQD